MYLNLTLREILVITVLFFIIALFVTTLYLFDDDEKKSDITLNFIFFAILIITIGSWHYKKTRESLVDGFYNNKELLCKEQSERKIIISKAKGFTLQSDYFIHEQNILYIGSCILLEDANQTKE